nr:hypothetical protein [Agrobacterium tumefaciens]ARU12446.1 hypothetical protein AgrTiChry5_24 [Agrobacterium tumefaciens]
MVHKPAALNRTPIMKCLFKGIEDNPVRFSMTLWPAVWELASLNRQTINFAAEITVRSS